jgi:hypothetical protein
VSTNGLCYIWHVKNFTYLLTYFIVYNVKLASKRSRVKARRSKELENKQKPCESLGRSKKSANNTSLQKSLTQRGFTPNCDHGFERKSKEKAISRNAFASDRGFYAAACAAHNDDP